MSIALQNQVDELEKKVVKLIREMQELHSLLKARPPELKRPPGRPKATGHIQP